MYHNTIDAGRTLSDQYEQRGGSTYHETPATAELVYVPDHGSDQPIEDNMEPSGSTIEAMTAAAAETIRQLEEHAPGYRCACRFEFYATNEADKPDAAWSCHVGRSDGTLLAWGRDADRQVAFARCLADLAAQRAAVLRAESLLHERGLQRLAADMGGVLVG